MNIILQEFCIIEKFAKLQPNINSCTAKHPRSLWNQGPRHAVVPLESVISILMHIYAFLLEVSVETSKRNDRTKRINSSKYIHKLKQKTKGEAIPANLNECKLQRLLMSSLNWTLEQPLLFCFTRKELCFLISHQICPGMVFIFCAS